MLSDHEADAQKVIEYLMMEGRGKELQAMKIIIDSYAALETELATLLDVAIARGEKLGYEDLDYRERLASLVPQEAGDESQNAV